MSVLRLNISGQELQIKTPAGLQNAKYNVLEFRNPGSVYFLIICIADKTYFFYNGYLSNNYEVLDLNNALFLDDIILHHKENLFISATTTYLLIRRKKVSTNNPFAGVKKLLSIENKKYPLVLDFNKRCWDLFGNRQNELRWKIDEAATILFADQY